MQAEQTSERSNLAANLFRLRKDRGHTQVSLAVAAGIAPATVARIETDVVHPQSDTLESLAAVLGCSVAELFAEVA